MKRQIFAIVFLVTLLLVACRTESEALRIATTTSTQDSGLMDMLLPLFEEKSVWGKEDYIRTKKERAKKMQEMPEQLNRSWTRQNIVQVKKCPGMKRNTPAK